MLKKPARPEIDHRTLKFIVGAIATGLPFVLSLLSGGQLPSLSDSFWIESDPWSRTIFVGCLYAISAFLLAYNGEIALEMVLSKIAALAALLVAMFPCDCSGHAAIVNNVHYVAAAALYLVLGGFCLIFLRRARGKRTREARYRQWIYAPCAAALWLAMLELTLNALHLNIFNLTYPVFWGESVGLVAFGIAWLTASHVLPAINSPDERHHLL